MNKLIVIGWLGNKHCYLNISRKEAIRRFEAAEGSMEVDVAEAIEEIEFKDEFQAYEIWPSS